MGDRNFSWVQFAFKCTVSLLVIAPVATIGACSARSYWFNREFEKVAIGDTEQEVAARFWSPPSQREEGGKTIRGYSNTPALAKSGFGT